MADLELSFTIQDGKKFKRGVFLIDGLTILDTDGNYEVNYDDIDLELDGEPYDGSLEAWRGKLSVENLFDQVLSGYFMGSDVYESFSDDWSVFSELNDLKEYKDGLLMKLPIYQYGDIYIYELDLATPDNRYYSCDDMVLMLDNDNEVVTDQEFFFMQGIDEDITAILKGELECLYMGYNVKEMINEAGGEAAWLENT